MINKIIVKNVATYDTEGIVIDKLEKVNYIYGANGCGKSTLLKTIARINKPTNGYIFINNKNGT